MLRVSCATRSSPTAWRSSARSTPGSSSQSGRLAKASSNPSETSRSRMVMRTAGETRGLSERSIALLLTVDKGSGGRGVSRLLSERGWRRGDHPSGTGVAAGLVRPTRGLDRAGLLRSRGDRYAPYLALLRVGFAKPTGHPAAGALLPHRFTLAAGAWPAAVCSLLHFPAGHPDWPLASTLPCGGRTFLGPWSGTAIARPTPPRHSASPAAAIQSSRRPRSLASWRILAGEGLSRTRCRGRSARGSVPAGPARRAGGDHRRRQEHRRARHAAPAAGVQRQWRLAGQARGAGRLAALPARHGRGPGPHHGGRRRRDGAGRRGAAAGARLPDRPARPGAAAPARQGVRPPLGPGAGAAAGLPPRAGQRLGFVPVDQGHLGPPRAGGPAARPAPLRHRPDPRPCGAQPSLPCTGGGAEVRPTGRRTLPWASMARLASASARRLRSRGTCCQVPRSKPLASRRTSSASGRRPWLRTFQRPSCWLTTSRESARTRTFLAPSDLACRSPAITPWYSATLLVAQPMPSDSSVSTAPSRSVTTTP